MRSQYKTSRERLHSKLALNPRQKSLKTRMNKQGNFIKPQDADIKDSLQGKSVGKHWIDLNCVKYFHTVI